MQEQTCQRAELACEPGQLGLIGLELELDLPHEHAKIQMPDPTKLKLDTVHYGCAQLELCEGLSC